MESLGLTYNLIYLKIKSKSPVQIYFMSRVFRNIVIVVTRGKNNKIKIRKIYLFLLPNLPYQDGGGVLQPRTPNFFYGKIFEIIFHSYIGIWTKGGYINQMAILAIKQKRHEGKSERGGGCNNPPPEREGYLIY